MKKLILKVILIFSATLTISGCSEFLEDENFSRVPLNTFYNNLGEARVALLGVYSSMIDGTGIQGGGFGSVGTWQRGNDWMLAANTDESVIREQGTNGDALTPLATLAYVSDNVQIRATWVGMYEGIYRANLVIQGTESIDVTAAEDVIIKNTIIAEARFMRSFYHFYLMSLYGGIPIMAEPTQDNNATRNTVEEVAAFIEEDFLFAIDNIVTPKMQTGRAGKFSAVAYLAKLHLFLASCKDNNVISLKQDGTPFMINSFEWVNATEHYQKAADFTDMIYGNYSLVPDYRYLFMIVGDVVQRDEFIFNVEVSPVSYTRHDRTFTTSGNGNWGGSAGHLEPQHQMLTMHHTGDDRIKTFQGRNIQNNAELIEGMWYPIVTQATSTTRNNWYNIAKWRRIHRTLNETLVFRGTSDVTHPLIRYADILLMRAEAHYKLTNSRTGIPDAMLTEVRERSTTDEADVTTLNATYLKPDFMVEMMEERSRELCYEGWRRIDLIRTNTYTSAIAGLDETQTAPNLRNRMNQMKANYQFYKMWYPIPRVEILLSPNLVQNPFYLEDY
jgi:hypothetical protein